MADRKEWKEQLLSKLLDQYEKSVTYVGENKVKQVFSVKPSDIFKGYNKDFLPPEQLFQEKEFERLIRQMESEGLIHVVPPNTGILRQLCAVPERWEDYYGCLDRTEKNILKKRLEEVYHRFCQCDLLEAYGKEKLQTLKNSRARKLDEKKVEKGNKNFLSGLFRQQIFIPIAALIILAVFNLIADPSFFKITLGYNSAGDPVLSGYLMTILDYGSELAILAIGMTLVTAASGGQDISVGAAIAIAGSVILRVLCGTNSRPDTLQAPIIVAFLVACVVAMLFGAFNGALVAYFKIQPMVATLILYTAGRSIAAWINNNELPIVSDPTFSYFGGFIPGIPIPTPFFIAAVCVLVIFLVLKFTTLGLYTQSVGINENSSKLNGLNPTFIKFLTFVILGLCVAVAALIKVSRLSSINYSVIAKDIEMDAILAVALGGNSLSGGKFNMAASILGAYVIQFLTTTLYKFDVQSDALPAYKAVVVILLVVLSTPKVREWLSAFGKKLKQGKAVKEVG